MTLEERADCIAALAGPGAVRGSLRQQRVRAMALRMLQEVVVEVIAMPVEGIGVGASRNNIISPKNTSEGIGS